MIPRIVDEVIEVAERLQVPLVQLSAQDAEDVMGRVARRFAETSNPRGHLWDRIVDAASVHDSRAWLRVDEHVGAESCLVIIDDTFDRYSGVRFPSGAAAVSVLCECSGFVFYVVPDDLSYVLCSNDHDMLIGAGTAKGWVMSTFREWEI